MKKPRVGFSEFKSSVLRMVDAFEAYCDAQAIDENSLSEWHEEFASFLNSIADEDDA